MNLFVSRHFAFAVAFCSVQKNVDHAVANCNLQDPDGNVRRSNRFHNYRVLRPKLASKFVLSS